MFHRQLFGMQPILSCYSVYSNPPCFLMLLNQPIKNARKMLVLIPYVLLNLALKSLQTGAFLIGYSLRYAFVGTQAILWAILRAVYYVSEKRKLMIFDTVVPFSVVMIFFVL